MYNLVATESFQNISLGAEMGRRSVNAAIETVETSKVANIKKPVSAKESISILNFLLLKIVGPVISPSQLIVKEDQP